MRKLFFPLALCSSLVEAQPLSDVVMVPRDSSAASIARFKALQAELSAGNQVVVDAPATRKNFDLSPLTVPPPENISSLINKLGEFSALPLSMETIEKVEADIERLVKNDPSSSPSFLTTLHDRQESKRTPFFSVSAASVPDNVMTPVITASSTGNFGVNATLATRLLRARAQGLAVRASEFQLLPAASKISSTVAPKFFGRYNATLVALEATLERPTSANVSELEENARLTRDEFTNAWPELRKDSAKRSNAVRRLDGLMEQSALKAVYALPSNFEPQTYEKIYRQAGRTVPLYESGSRFCTGYLLSKDWLMTAGHCLKRSDIQDISIRIAPPKAGDPEVSISVDGQWPSTGTGRTDADPIDYVFLHLAPNKDSQTLIDVLQNSAPLCLSTMSPQYKRPIVVIAHRPDTNLKVYDHAYVWFPFQIGPQKFQEMSAMAGARLQRLAESWFVSQAKRESFFEESMSKFEASYKVVGQTRQYRSEHPGLAERPYFGMDTDTYRGNSGAPVFLREEVCVVGVFSGGALDGAKIQEATWKEHEFAVPLSEIVKHVRSLDIAADGATDAEKLSRQNLLALLPQ